VIVIGIGFVVAAAVVVAIWRPWSGGDAARPVEGWQTYVDPDGRFTVGYPPGVTPEEQQLTGGPAVVFSLSDDPNVKKNLAVATYWPEGGYDAKSAAETEAYGFSDGGANVISSQELVDVAGTSGYRNVVESGEYRQVTLFVDHNGEVLEIVVLAPKADYPSDVADSFVASFELTG
jgi:hypothetical protein